MSNSIGDIPVITSQIRPEQIDASSAIGGGFGSSERETIAQAVVRICQRRGTWKRAVTADEIKAELAALGEDEMSTRGFNLEARNVGPCCDGMGCPNVGDGLLLQKIGEDTYAVTDQFIETCYEKNPMK